MLRKEKLVSLGFKNIGTFGTDLAVGRMLC